MQKCWAKSLFPILTDSTVLPIFWILQVVRPMTIPEGPSQLLCDECGNVQFGLARVSIQLKGIVGYETSHPCFVGREFFNRLDRLFIGPRPQADILYAGKLCSSPGKLRLLRLRKLSERR
jgi:hypothetical protein